MILTIKEYEKLFVRDRRDLENKQISQSDAAYLQSLVIDEMPVFAWGNRCLIAQQWVGCIDLPDYTIEILPKIYGRLSDTMLRQVLIRMILVSNQITTEKRFQGSLASQKNALHEILIDAFLTALEKYEKSGLICAYRKVEKNIGVIKGKILFYKQFKQNVFSPTKFYCSFTKYIQDNDLNQFICTCLKQMQKASRDAENKKRIRSSLSIFNEIHNLTIEEALCKNISFNSTNKIAEDAYKFGRLFLSNNFMTLNAGNMKMNAMLFDMNKLFELFIFRVAKKAYGSKAHYQSTGHYLISNSKNRKKYINLRPDIMIVDPDSIAVIDTKWKIPKSFAKESDIYQINAYSTGIERVRKVFLLYPYTVENDNIVGDYTFISNDGSQRKLGIRTVDLAKCLDYAKFIKYFKTMFQE